MLDRELGKGSDPSDGSVGKCHGHISVFMRRQVEVTPALCSVGFPASKFQFCLACFLKIYVYV